MEYTLFQVKPTCDSVYTTPEPTEDPTSPKAKRIRPTSRAAKLRTDKDDSEADDTPGAPGFLFSSPTTPGSDSIQKMGK